MTWLVMLASVFVAQTTTGQMSNPLRVYGSDNREYLVTFARGGLDFEGHSFEPLGGNRFRYEAEAPGCDTTEPQHVETVLRLVERGVEIKTSEVFVACADAKATTRYTRLLSFFKTPGEPTCKAGPRELKHGTARVVVDARCDGTLVLTAEFAPPIRLTEKRPGRFAGSVGRFRATLTFTGSDMIRVRLVGPGRVIEGPFGTDLP